MKKSSKASKPKVNSGSSATIDILDAFVRLASDIGAGNITHQELAKEAGVAFGTIHYHFGSQGKDLAQEAVQYVLKNGYNFVEDYILRERMNKDFDPVKSYVNAMFEWIDKKSAEAAILVHYYYLCTTKLALAVPNSVFVGRARLRINGLIHEAIGRGLYKAKGNVEQMAVEIHSIIAGCCLIAGTARDQKVWEEQRNVCLRLIDIFLGKNTAKD